jgi:hypothetical protein
MGSLSIVVRHLKMELERAQEAARRFGAALAALGSSNSNEQRTLSAAARRKISLAQKARWTKQKPKSQAGTIRPERTISAAGRRRIVAAQRARWAKDREKKAA